MAKSKITTPAKGFTAKFLDNLKPRDERYELADKACPGLRLRVTPAGRKSFVWYYNDDGKNRVLTLGAYGKGDNCISLIEARKALATAKERHADGELVGAPADTPETVEALAEKFYECRIKQRKVPEVVRRILDNDIIPRIGKKKLRTISTLTIGHMIEQVVARGAKTHAGSVLSVTKQMFRFAQARGFTDRNPADVLVKKDLGVVDNIRERYLTAEEIPALWKTLDRYERLSEPTRIGLRILLLTGVRTNELLKARWAHIDLDKGEWFIPEQNSKTVAWTVPVVPQVRALFDALKEIADDFKSPWVMPGRTPDRPITDKVMARSLRRLFELKDKDGAPPLTIEPCCPHDFRRTLRSHLDDFGIPPHVSEKCLNHSLGRIEKTYNRNTLLSQRREALQRWADYVDLLVTERTNVVVLHG